MNRLNIIVKTILCTIILFFSLTCVAFQQDPGANLLYAVQNELIAKTDPKQTFHHITYDITLNNQFADNGQWLLQNPLEKWWGVNAAKLPYYLFSKNHFNDFGLPFCLNDNDCSQWHGSKSCRHLNAFFNGIVGKQDKMCLGHSDEWVDPIYNAMIQAHHFIDITTIEPFPDRRFLAAIRNALTYLAYQKRPITVRILEGLYPFGPPDTQENATQAKLDWDRARSNDIHYLQSLVQTIKNIPKSQLKIYVASMRTCDGGLLCAGVDLRLSQIPYRFSANHAKLIIVDGETVINGGENLRNNEYLQDAPVHDVSMIFSGSAAWQAHRFVNQLWQFVCAKHHLPSLGVVSDWRHFGIGSSQCPASIHDIKPTYPSNHIAVMSIGTLGTGMFFAHPNKGDQSEVARTLFFEHAKHTIRIAQEDLGYNSGKLGILWQRSNAAGNDLMALARLLLNHGDVYIVTSNYGAIRLPEPSTLKDTYSNYVPLPEVGLVIERIMKLMNRQLSNQSIHQLVCRHLYLAPIRFSDQSNQWDAKHKIANHSKIWIIDNDAFYIGSHNMYPSGMQEFGFVVGNQHLTQEFMQHYWDHLWQYSKRVAISGKGVPCQIPFLKLDL